MSLKIIIYYTKIVSKYMCNQQYLFKEINILKDQNIFIFNKMISEYCIKNGIPYIDLNSHLSTEELGLKKEYTYDGIHLNGNGYKVWKSILSSCPPFIEAEYLNYGK